MSGKVYDDIFVKNKCEFLTCALSQKFFPKSNKPEILFVGRSNVGKSTVINTLTCNKKLSHVSNSPGSTDSLKFFSIGGLFMIVDSPGYGYIKKSKSFKGKWNETMKIYIEGRKNLSCAFLFIDSRRIIMPIDFMMMDFLEASKIYYYIVITKKDKVGQNSIMDLNNSINELATNRLFLKPLALATSVSDNKSFSLLRRCIFKVIYK